MKFNKRFAGVVLCLFLVPWFSLSGNAQVAPAQPESQSASRRAVPSHRSTARPALADTSLCATCIRENLAYLAGPELHGRGSGTEDEQRAAEYIAEKLRSYGLEPAAESGQFIQTATVESRRVNGESTLTVGNNADSNANRLVLTHGKQIAISMLDDAVLSARIQKFDLSGTSKLAADVKNGAALLVKLKPGLSVDKVRAVLEPYRNSKAALVIIEASPAWTKTFDKLASHPPEISPDLGDHVDERAPLVLAKPDSFAELWKRPEGTVLSLQADITTTTTNAWNVVARIEGTSTKQQIILLSAHLDHLGVVNGETYYGADDDASGTVAVMELARVLAQGPKPARTVIFALWGSEEKGLVGARYFLQHPTFPLKDVIANLEFEMIGRPDPKLKQDQLWLTGWDRTNLGPMLAAHGAKLVADPHQAEKFFKRSDNYALAKDGIIAQTVSSYGLHADYHQPTDTVAKIDFQHMDQAIGSMIGPIRWLASSSLSPAWVAGKKP